MVDLVVDVLAGDDGAVMSTLAHAIKDEADLANRTS